MIKYPQLETDKENGPYATIVTDKGDIKIKLFPDQAPNTVKNFIELANANYYDHCNFHRVINDFMIQTGDPTGTGNGGESIWHHPFEDEFSDQLYNLRGAVSMANAGPNTNGSQFFIVQNKKTNPEILNQLKEANFPSEIITAYKQLGGTPWLDFRHTVFGQVVSGMNVVDQIATVPVDAADSPRDDVLINQIKISE
ncbi:peptidylprolyl isomerase [Nicoliella spurrieriana]|uniref:Peptidyl-prolyl cis-trans isomerase n=1 Tax=Nicoliella spurrieriana TaxID=2925830 RepID=A0A976X5K1_9LACO|nr:peptidylprolyl isomerase [Nicoliella spurrieriana]UQS86759.1 peptidylprolyl isomerase [Nicoliella spurrieriana]